MCNKRSTLTLDKYFDAYDDTLKSGYSMVLTLLVIDDFSSVVSLAFSSTSIAVDIVLHLAVKSFFLQIASNYS